MSIDREIFKNAIQPSSLGRVELEVGGFKNVYEMSTLLKFINLMLENVSWTSNVSFENQISHTHAIGKLKIPQFYNRDLRDALLPNFLEGESGKKLLGIQEIKFYVTNNDWSFRQQPNGYHSIDGDSIADTFYNATLKLKIGDQMVDFSLVKFYGDTRDKGSRDDGYIDTMHRGDIYDAIYLLSVIPIETWKAIWATDRSNYAFAGYVFRRGRDGIITVTSNRYNTVRADISADPIIIVERERVGMSDVEEGKLKSQRRSR